MFLGVDIIQDMTEPPEIEELAKRYLDLWQDHVSGLSNDPEWMAAMTRLFSSFSTMQTADAAAKPDFDAFNAWLGGTFGDSQSEAAATGPAASTDSPADGGHDIHELERRVAALEKRLAKLEPGDGSN